MYTKVIEYVYIRWSSFSCNILENKYIPVLVTNNDLPDHGPPDGPDDVPDHSPAEDILQQTQDQGSDSDIGKAYLIYKLQLLHDFYYCFTFFLSTYKRKLEVFEL